MSPYNLATTVGMCALDFRFMQAATCTSRNVGIAGAKALTWSDGLLTVGVSPTRGSLLVDTRSFAGGYFSGFDISGSYEVPHKRPAITDRDTRGKAGV